MPAVSSHNASAAARLLHPNEVQLITTPTFASESSAELGSQAFCFTSVKHQQNRTVTWNTLQRETRFDTLQSEPTGSYWS